MKPKWKTRADGTQWLSPGLSFCPYRSALMVDTKIIDTNVPFSGPSQDIHFLGVPRKMFYKDTQESIFTGYGKRHGMKLETTFMPNAIATVFGPVPCRLHDSSGPDSVQEMSGLGQFLKYIQMGREHLTPPYSGFGDCKYGLNIETLRTYFKVYFPKESCNDKMVACDDEMKAIREGIEWDYGKTGNIFKITKNPDNFKLGKKNPVSGWQIKSRSYSLVKCNLSPWL